MGPAHVSFVEAVELGAQLARAPVWVERVEHRELRVELLVCEDDHGELVLAAGLPGSEPLAAAADARGLRVIPTPGDRPSLAATQLREYLDGARTEFDLRVAPGPMAGGGTTFELAAWRALAAIPHGQTRSYAEQAAALGRPGAARAVGRANGRNPIPILIPCHRVIGSDGSLTGFAGGLPVKRWLLTHEGVRLRPQPEPRAQLGLFA